MSAHRHPNWLKEARRAEGGGVADDDKVRSKRLDEAMQENMDVAPRVGARRYQDEIANHSDYQDTIDRANASGADPADVQDILQGAMHKGD